MGVDINTFRARIGIFNGIKFKKTKVGYFNVAIVMFGVSCGALSFILTLMIKQGIEPNPGPWTLEAIFPPVLASLLGLLIVYVIFKLLQQGEELQSHTTQQTVGEELQRHTTQQTVGEVQQSHTTQQTVGEVQQSHTTQQTVGEVQQSHNTRQTVGEVQQSHTTQQTVGEVQQSHTTQQRVGEEQQSHTTQQTVGEEQQSHTTQQTVGEVQQSHTTQQTVGEEQQTSQQTIESQSSQQTSADESQSSQQATGGESKTIQLYEHHPGSQQVLDCWEHGSVQISQSNSVNIGHVGIAGFGSTTFNIHPVDTARGKNIEQSVTLIKQKMEQQDVKLDKQTDLTEKISGQLNEDNPGRRAMIGTTKVTIDRCTHQDQFVPTKAFKDAKTKLCQQKIIIIKGNSGDGKTRTAHELVAWMWKGERYRKLPIQFYNLDNCDKIVEPNLNLCIFIDDVSTDLFKEIEKRHEFIKSLISGEMNGKSNCLVITLRNDIFKSMSSCSIFVEENVVDTSSEEYHIKEEKQQILDIYLPKDVKFSKTERSEIVESAPDIGFPQCCRVYRDIPELQKQGVKFFLQPFHFMKIALSNLENGRCAALLYLFFCGGEFETGLDVFSDEIDKEKLQAAFEVKLLEDVKIPDLSSDVKKIEFVMESLDCLCGSLVVKDTGYKWKDGHYITYEYYKFSHDSIRDTVALLYGEKTKIGFIKNCHCNSLCYITTSKNTPNKIFIDPDNKHMYSRLLRELKYKQSENYKCIASLDVWNDSQFMSGFFRWLDGEGIDEDFYLKWTTKDVGRHGPYHFYTDRGDRFYSESDDSDSSDGGDRYWGHTYFPSFLVYVAHTNNLCLLNQLLERTPKDHPQLHGVLFGVVRAGHIGVFNMIIERGINPTVRADWSESSHGVFDINVLHEACLFERVEMVTKLATKYPSLVQDTCHDGVLYGLPTLHVVVMTGNCSWYDTVETFVLGDISREDRVKRLSEMVDDDGRTVLCYSCEYNCSDTMVLHLLHKYPELVSIRDDDGCHCLHLIVQRYNKDLFIQVDSYLQKYYKDKGINYDITTIVNNLGGSVLDWAKEEWRDDKDMCSYLSQFWS